MRPYRFHSVPHLRDMARETWSIAAKLREIETELAGRSGHAATELRDEVAARIAELDPRGSRPARAFGTATPLLPADVAGLQARLAEAEAEILRLRAAQSQPAFRKVGLDQAAPDFVIRAARTAWRKACHPDVTPEPERAEAQRRFVAAEEAFDEVFAARGLTR